jgi:hypothetical protein
MRTVYAQVPGPEGAAKILTTATSAAELSISHLLGLDFLSETSRTHSWTPLLSSEF